MFVKTLTYSLKSLTAKQEVRAQAKAEGIFTNFILSKSPNGEKNYENDWNAQKPN